MINRWKNLSKGAKSSIAFVLSSFIIKGITFLTTPVFTRILSSNEYGIIATYNSWTTIIEVFAFLGLTSAGAFNVGLNEHKKDRDSYISSILVLCNIVTIITFAFIFILKSCFGESFMIETNLLLCMFLRFFFCPAQIFWITRSRYEYEYKVPFIITILSSLISQVFSVICIFNVQNELLSNAEIKIWSSNIALLIIEIPIYFYLIRRGKKLIDTKLWKSTLIFVLPLIPHYLSQHVMNSSDKIMISELVGNSQTAVYSVIVNLGVIATLIWSAINASLVPFVFDKIEKNDSKAIDNVVFPLALFYACACVLVGLFAPEIINILAPKEYADGIYATAPIMSTAFLSAMYNIFANVEFYYKKTKWIALSTFIAAMLNVGLNYVFVPRIGYVAAAYTTFVSNAVLVLLHKYGYNKAHGSSIFNDKSLILLSVFTTMACMLCNVLYKFVILRYFIVVVFVSVIAWKRTLIIDKIKLIKKR